MKQLIAYLLIASFALQSCPQAWIYASFYLRRDYIANNLCINRFDAVAVCRGQCYLNQQLAGSVQDEFRQIPEVPFQEAKWVAHRGLSFRISPEAGRSADKIPQADHQLLPHELLESVFQPPEA